MVAAMSILSTRQAKCSFCQSLMPDAWSLVEHKDWTISSINLNLGFVEVL